MRCPDSSTHFLFSSRSKRLEWHLMILHQVHHQNSKKGVLDRRRVPFSLNFWRKCMLVWTYSAIFTTFLISSDVRIVKLSSKCASKILFCFVSRSKNAPGRDGRYWHQKMVLPFSYLSRLLCWVFCKNWKQTSKHMSFWSFCIVEQRINIHQLHSEQGLPRKLDCQKSSYKFGSLIAVVRTGAMALKMINWHCMGIITRVRCRVMNLNW